MSWGGRVRNGEEGDRARAAARPAPKVDGLPLTVRGVLWKTGDAAAALGKTPNTILNWEKKGLQPLHPGDPKTSSPKLFDSLDVIEFMLSQELGRLIPSPGLGGGAEPMELLSKDQEQAQLYRSQRRKLDIEIAKQEAALLDAVEVATAQGHVFGNLRARFLAMPSKLAPLVAAEKNRALCARLIEDAVYEALEELSQMEVVPDDGSVPVEVEAPAPDPDPPGRPRKRKDGRKSKRKPSRPKAAVPADG